MITPYPKCRTCKHWKLPEDPEDFPCIFPDDAKSYVYETTEAEIQSKGHHRVRVCTSPHILFHQRPMRSGAAVVDGSEYFGKLISGGDFGCCLHEPIEGGKES